MSFEAWKLIYDNPNLFIFSNAAQDERILFFNVMAHHKALDDSKKFSDEWTLPDFTGWSCAEIACALKNINQSYEVKFIEDDTMQHNVVLKQEPVSGEIISRNDNIILYANSAFCSPPSTSMHEYLELIMVECGEWLYYVGNMDDSKIYRTHIDFSEQEIIYDLNDENSPYFFPLVAKENYVYFVEEYPDNKFLLQKINSDGSEVNTLVSEEQFDSGTYPTNIRGNFIYCHYFSYNIENGQYQQLNNENTSYPWRFITFDNKAYYYKYIKNDDNIFVSSIYSDDIDDLFSFNNSGFS